MGNGWNQTITLTSIYIPLPGKRQLALFRMEGEQQMPVALAPGSSTRFWCNSDQLQAQIMSAGIRYDEKFRVKAGDALGNVHLSNSISFKPMK